MLDRIAQLEEEALHEIKAAQDMEALKELRVRYLGKKGALTALLRRMGELDPEQRPAAGRKANNLRKKIEELLG